MRISLFSIALALLPSLGLTQERQPSPLPSTVCVLSNDGAGSGTVVARQGDTALILTNQHVVDGAKKLWIVQRGKPKVKATLLAEAPKGTDLALVTAEIPNPAVAIADREPKAKDRINHFGHATGPQKGHMVGWANYTDGRAMISDIFSIVGDSGAGLFNADNELVGVHWGRSAESKQKWDDDETLENSVPLDAVKKFLEDKAPAKKWEYVER